MMAIKKMTNNKHPENPRPIMRIILSSVDASLKLLFRYVKIYPTIKIIAKEKNGISIR